MGFESGAFYNTGQKALTPEEIWQQKQREQGEKNRADKERGRQLGAYTLNDIYKTEIGPGDYEYEHSYDQATGRPVTRQVLKPGVAEAIARNKAIQARMTGYETRQLDPGYQAELRAAASGQAPSAAELMLRRQAGSDISQQYALANSARGGFNPLYQREASRNAATIAAQRGEAAGILRAQEQANARQAYGQYVLGQQGLGDTMSRAVLGDVTQRDVASMGGRIDLDKQREMVRQFENQLALAKTQQERAFWSNIIGSVLGAGGAVGAAAA